MGAVAALIGYLYMLLISCTRAVVNEGHTIADMHGPMHAGPFHKGHP